jgi:hypothetical protein
MRNILSWALALALTGAAGTAWAAPKKAADPKAAKTTTKAPESKPAEPKAGDLVCVGIYSETDAGYISARVGGGAWTPIKIGDKVPANAEIKVTVDRDWIELTPSDNPAVVFELNGENGEVTKTVADVLKGKPRQVPLPKANGDKADPAFANKLIVTQYLGRQVYTNAGGDDKDIKYGDVLAPGGKVSIIAINNTLTLMNASAKVTTVVGPLKFDVDKVLKNEKLYKYLNVPR